MEVEEDLYQIQDTLTGRDEAISKLNRAPNAFLTRLDGFSTAHAQAEARLNGLEDVPARPPPNVSAAVPPVASFLSLSLRIGLRCVAIPTITRRLLHSLNLPQIPRQWQSK